MFHAIYNVYSGRLVQKRERLFCVIYRLLNYRLPAIAHRRGGNRLNRGELLKIDRFDGKKEQGVTIQDRELLQGRGRKRFYNKCA